MNKDVGVGRYDPFARPITDAAIRAADRRVRTRIATEVRPRSLAPIAGAPYVTYHGVHVQPGGPSRTPASPAPRVRFATRGGAYSKSPRRRYAEAMRRRSH